MGGDGWEGLHGFQLNRRGCGRRIGVLEMHWEFFNDARRRLGILLLSRGEVVKLICHLAVSAWTEAAGRLYDLFSLSGALETHAHQHETQGHARVEYHQHVVEGIVLEPETSLSHKLVSCQSGTATAASFKEETCLIHWLLKAAARASSCAHHVGFLGDVEQLLALNKHCAWRAAVDETTLHGIHAHRGTLVRFEVVRQLRIDSRCDWHR